ADLAERRPPGLDEERGDEAPGDEGRDVRHDHAGEERAELLHRDPGTTTLLCCRFGHVITFLSVEAPRAQRPAGLASSPRDRRPQIAVVGHTLDLCRRSASFSPAGRRKVAGTFTYIAAEQLS